MARQWRQERPGRVLVTPPAAAALSRLWRPWRRWRTRRELRAAAPGLYRALEARRRERERPGMAASPGELARVLAPPLAATALAAAAAWWWLS